jgi:uncharacterized protein (TIGR02145 family)
MKKRLRIRIIPVAIIGLLLILTNNCKKSDDNNNNTSLPVYDNDGNVYSTVVIGTQVWMSGNLRTTRYNDGTPVPNVTYDIGWQNLNTGAYSWHNNDAANKNPYGALYNWYAVSTGKLCPAGWHVPGDADWTTLENYLIANGYNYDGTTQGNKIAKSLSDTINWPESVTAGAVGNNDFPAYRNKTGFSALPGGMRGARPEDSNFGFTGYWWSATASDASNSWYRSIYFDASNVFRSDAAKFAGFSVRCLRNN